MKAMILLMMLAACSGQPKDEHAAVTSAPVQAQSTSGTGPSIYDLSISLRRAAGDHVGLDVDRGHPTLISMFYGSCAAACPVLVDTVQRTLDQLPAGERGDVRVVLVSFDPARDTPERLRELARVHRLDDRWTLASAAESDARTLAAVLGIRYRAVAGGQFFHTSAVVALDREGREIARIDGLRDTSALVSAMEP